MYDGKSSEKNPNQSSVENAVEREATFFLRSLRSRSPYMYPQLTCAPPTHLCPPLHHYVHHRSAPRRPRSQLQRVRRDAISRLPYGEVSRNASGTSKLCCALSLAWRCGGLCPRLLGVPPSLGRAQVELAEVLADRAPPLSPIPTPPPTTSRPASRYRFTQADCERVGRVMTLTKTKLRSSLSDEHFEQSVWVQGGVQLAWDS